MRSSDLKNIILGLMFVITVHVGIALPDYVGSSGDLLPFITINAGVGITGGLAYLYLKSQTWFLSPKQTRPKIALIGALSVALVLLLIFMP